MNKKKSAYHWEGVNSTGEKIKGIMDASCIAVVKTELHKLGIHYKKIAPQEQIFLVKKIKQSEISLFCRQLATLLKAGIPLIQACDIIANHHANSFLKPFIEMLKKDIQAGLSFSESLHKYPTLFSDLICSLIQVGEKSGKMDLILEKIAQHKENNALIKKRLHKALAYPTVVLLIAFLVSFTLLTFVIPQFEFLFDSFGADLPLLTKLVIHLSKSVDKYGLVIGILGLSLIYSIIIAKKRSAKLIHLIDEILIKIPLLGEIIIKIIVARFTRTLAITFASGLPVIDALKAAEGVTGNQVYAAGVSEIRKSVTAGQPIQLAIKNTRLFPEMAIQMIAIGEESGRLELMLNKIADLYEEEVSNAIDLLTKMLEPIIMTILGVIVGGLVIAMYLPIFKLGSVI